MTIQALSLAPNNVSNATFRAWGSGISAALAAAGLVNTADTGQINWATVVLPGAGAAAGYEIWRFSDALQASAPVFIKLEYGSSGLINGTHSAPQMWITVGTATDGAGTIQAAVGFPNSTSVRTNLLQVGVQATNSWDSATNNPIWVDSDAGSSLLIAGWAQCLGATNATGGGTVTVVERSRNWDGSVNGEGVTVLVMYPSGNPPAVGQGVAFAQTIMLANAGNFKPVTAGNNTWPAYSGTNLMGNPTKSAVVGGVVYAWPIFTGATPRLGAPSRHVIGLFALDMPVALQLSFTIYGVAHTFQSFGQYGGGTAADASTTSCAWRIN
jgi:hypothetical protein